MHEVNDRRGYSDNFKELVEGMLCLSPEDRWSLDKVRGSRWAQEGEMADSEEARQLMKRRLSRE
jgi:hypothetical protein